MKARLAAMVEGVRHEQEMVHIFRGVIVDNCLETDHVVLSLVAVGIVRAYSK